MLEIFQVVWNIPINTINTIKLTTWRVIFLFDETKKTDIMFD
jgi:hypothetical protein